MDEKKQKQLMIDLAEMSNPVMMRMLDAVSPEMIVVSDDCPLVEKLVHTAEDCLKELEALWEHQAKHHPKTHPSSAWSKVLENLGERYYCNESQVMFIFSKIGASLSQEVLKNVYLNTLNKSDWRDFPSVILPLLKIDLNEKIEDLPHYENDIKKLKENIKSAIHVHGIPICSVDELRPLILAKNKATVAALVQNGADLNMMLANGKRVYEMIQEKPESGFLNLSERKEIINFISKNIKVEWSQEKLWALTAHLKQSNDLEKALISSKNDWPTWRGKYQETFLHHAGLSSVGARPFLAVLGRKECKVNGLVSLKDKDGFLPLDYLASNRMVKGMWDVFDLLGVSGEDAYHTFFNGLVLEAKRKEIFPKYRKALTDKSEHPKIKEYLVSYVEKYPEYRDNIERSLCERIKSDFALAYLDNKDWRAIQLVTDLGADFFKNESLKNNMIFYSELFEMRKTRNFDPKKVANGMVKSVIDAEEFLSMLGSRLNLDKEYIEMLRSEYQGLKLKTDFEVTNTRKAKIL